MTAAAAPRPVNARPATLAGFRDAHRGEAVVVCGCGPSLNDFGGGRQLVTIGVNDVGRLFDPTYLVVVNPRSQFKSDRFAFVEGSNARALFTQAQLGAVQPPVVRFRLGAFGGTEIGDEGVLHYTQNSPYVAVCLAAYMGARRIGLIGVDLTDDHFFGRTGRHPLAGRLTEIDGQYRRLYEALRRRGIELVNLSAASRLTSLPRTTTSTFTATPAAAPVNDMPVAPARRRVFFVNYRFLACGDVFATGLAHGADALGVEHRAAWWDDPKLPGKIADFAPDLVFVVHGRRAAERWKRELQKWKTAVWLLDEPYEVDDTSRWSSAFDTVFVNDPSSMHRHRNAHPLPVCFDPALHHDTDAAREHQVGFIGGYNPVRERYLVHLAEQGLLSYVVGGPWRAPSLRRFQLTGNATPAETAALYRQTRIVLNVFRSVHHFNRERIVGTALNPRIFEALACGAMVVSEPRPALAATFPELPTFADEADLIGTVRALLDQPAECSALIAASRTRLVNDDYAARLAAALATSLGDIPLARTKADPPSRGVRIDGRECPAKKQNAVTVATRVLPQSRRSRPMDTAVDPRRAELPLVPEGWELCGPVSYSEADGGFALRATLASAPGSERGLVTDRAYRNVALSFEVFIPTDACFIAKINQAAKLDQQTNSYHLYVDGPRGYLARHHCVFNTFDIPRDRWVRLSLTYLDGVVVLRESGVVLHRVRDDLLTAGFLFIGAKRGEVLLRDVQLGAPLAEDAAAPPTFDAEVLIDRAADRLPRVSIVTTVFDRVDCLTECIRSVRSLRYEDYEHIVVSDCPPPHVVSRIAGLVQAHDDSRIRYLNLARRHNNWGIAPAAVGLRHARGEYVAFLSDDNGYTPQHVAMLAGVLDQDPSLGFVYSSCHYGGRLILRHPVPAPARIDLGQPMFRRDLFRAHLWDDLPFNMMAWDWALIDTFIRRGVRWKHVDVPSFIFRLAKYPHLMAPR